MKNLTENQKEILNFMFVNFGDRGSSTVEAAAIGGVAHLTCFNGTDNFNSLRYANHYYNEPSAGISIPATEHSSTTSWLKENEDKMIMNHLETNKGSFLIAAVCDSYDYFRTVDSVTSGEFKEKIESDEYPNFVIRPDSGDPVEIISGTLDIMEKNNVKYTINSKGYKKFANYSLIWGDGINMKNIKEILELLLKRGYSADNIAFGSGGWLMQDHTRDSQGWALKCSSITVDEGGPIDAPKGSAEWEEFLIERDVFKDPITAPNKKSKKGKVTLWYNKATEEYFTASPDYDGENAVEMLQTIYKNGEIFNETTLEEIRKEI